MKLCLFLVAAFVANTSFAAESKVLCVAGPAFVGEKHGIKAAQKTAEELNALIATENYTNVSAPSILFNDDNTVTICVTVLK